MQPKTFGVFIWDLHCTSFHERVMTEKRLNGQGIAAFVFAKGLFFDQVKKLKFH